MRPGIQAALCAGIIAGAAQGIRDVDTILSADLSVEETAALLSGHVSGF